MVNISSVNILNSKTDYCKTPPVLEQPRYKGLVVCVWYVCIPVFQERDVNMI